MMQDYLFFLASAPQILDETDLAAMDRQLTAEGVAAALKKRYLQLMKPEGMFLGTAVRNDPLDIQSLVGARIQKLSSSFGYRVKPEDGHLVSEDGRHVLLILDTPVHMTDGTGSRELVEYLQAKVAEVPATIAADIICGHLHTVSNEQVVKRDITLTMSIASVSFLLLFVLVFRDARAVLVFLVPLAAALFAIHLSALVLGRLSYLVIGLGSVIAGIAVDYGIHVYVAVRHRLDTEAAVREIAKPVFLGAVTTLAVFSSFYFSHIRGYHQLAWFSILSILLSLACALFVLPHFVHPRPGCGEEAQDPVAVTTGRRKRDSAFAMAWAVLLLLAVPLCFRVPFDSRVTQLDGAAKSILDAEARFNETWGSGSGGQALLLVSGTNYQDALAVNDRLYQEAGERLGRDVLTSFSSIWPSRAVRKGHAARWAQFWRDGREARLRQWLAEKGSSYSFATNAFDPFFEHLYDTAAAGEPEQNRLFNQLKEQFVRKVADGYRIISFFPDGEDSVRALNELGAAAGGLVVSPKALGMAISETFSREITVVSIIALVLILLVTFALLRDVRMALISLAPPVTAVVWLLAAMSLFGLTLNVANLIAGIVVFGLCIDYGIFVTHSCRHHLRTGTRLSIHLSAITTLVGAGVLLFAHHPALFSIGFTLVIGVFSGYVTALLVVPALCARFLNRAAR